MNIRPLPRVNHKIRAPTVRCVDADGTMVGIMATKDALKLAQERGLDLVEVAPTAAPPVCRIMDFGKYRYEESLKEREARKHQKSRSVKEIKFHANVAEHDYATKVNHIREFLQKGHKVKVSLMFRGRENLHRELGFEVVNRVLKDCEDLCVVDMPPKMVGRSIVAMLGSRPVKS
ncbi:MAG: translation initiation factor IF-3 [Kiritimatiellae bacterium]|nr:translation initiation factor IF-3 [Kiritimatiellia bacterium]